MYLWKCQLASGNKWTSPTEINNPPEKALVIDNNWEFAFNLIILLGKIPNRKTDKKSIIIENAFIISLIFIYN